MSKTIETPPKKWMAHKLLHPCNFNGLFMEKIDVVVLLHLPHFWSCIQPVFSLWKLTLLSFCIWHTFGVASNLSFHGENWRCHSFAFGTLLELHPTCLFMEKIDVVIFLHLAHFWSCIQPVFSWRKLTLSSFCIWHTFGVTSNLSFYGANWHCRPFAFGTLLELHATCEQFTGGPPLMQFSLQRIPLKQFLAYGCTSEGFSH